MMTQGHIDLTSLGYAWQANSLDSTPTRWKISNSFDSQIMYVQINQAKKGKRRL